MATINYAYREILCKVVYYGPGVGGKTTNLQVVHGQVDASARGDLVSLATETERTLYFDFLPLDLGEIKGFKVRFQLYTVPGQVQYNATRKLVLQGVDGLVFVADSQAERMDENIQSLQNLCDNLRDYNMTLEDIPYVLQLNKRDLKNISSVEELTEQLCVGNCPVFEAVALTGQGVKQTLKKILGLVLQKLHEQAVGEKGESPFTVEEQEPAKPEMAPAPLPATPAVPPIAPPTDSAPPRPTAPLPAAAAPPAKPAKTRVSPLQAWLKELPSSVVRQRCDVFWNQTLIGRGSLEMQRDGDEEHTTTPKFMMNIDGRVFGLFRKKEDASVFASINSQRTTGFGEYFILVDKQLLGITGDVRFMDGWRVYLKKGDTPFIYAMRRTIGGQFLLVPEGQREVSPE